MSKSFKKKCIEGLSDFANVIKDRKDVPLGIGIVIIYRDRTEEKWIGNTSCIIGALECIKETLLNKQRYGIKEL